MEKLWNKEEVAEYLGLEPRSIEGMVYKKTIPHVKLSGRILRFEPDKIRAWIEERRKEVRE